MAMQYVWLGSSQHAQQSNKSAKRDSAFLHLKRVDGDSGITQVSDLRFIFGLYRDKKRDAPVSLR
jgi:hypothetical protein